MRPRRSEPEAGDAAHTGRLPGERGEGAAFPTVDATPTFRSAAATAAGLSVLFMVVYSACNLITTRRTDVGVWHYDWENLIPFVPLMIVPYMTIDAFFVGAPFLCTTHAELRALRRRIVMGILVAGACFLLLPLRMAAPRPQPTGWTGAIFSFLHGFDQPHNLFPSLHITLRTILAATFGRHTRGWLNVAVHVWFSLIGISTLLTSQHHVADVIGGFVLAAFCFFVIREEEPENQVTTNRRVGVYYLVGAAGCAALAFIRWPWTSLLLWPALSLTCSATIYFGRGAAVFGKANGLLPWSTRLILGPSLLGQRVSKWFYRRRCAAWDEVTPRLWIGAALSKREAAEIKRCGVTAVLDLTAEFSEPRATRTLCYRNIQVADLTAFTPRQLSEAVDFISQQAGDGVVFVHCKIGYSRSATAVAAYLLASQQAPSIEAALSMLRRVRPTIVFRPEVKRSLLAFQARFSASTVSANT